MGIAQAGLVFRTKAPISNYLHLVARLSGETATQIPHPDAAKFDIRNHSDVMVQVFGDVCFVCNNDLVWETLENSNHDVFHMHSAIDSPDLWMAFCHYDSGGSYGYTVVEKGVKTRTRLQTTGVPRPPPIVESGSPLAFEVEWLSAPFYYEDENDAEEDHIKVYYRGNREVLVREDRLTEQMLDDCLISLFGVCPWETSEVPKYYFFKLQKTKKPWWKLGKL